jgi:methanogenic corrinoid protein MtbC1
MGTESDDPAAAAGYDDDPAAEAAGPDDPAADEAGLDEPAAAYRLAILSAVLEGDSGTAFHLARRLMDEGSAFDEVLFDVLGSVQAELGFRWMRGDYRIAEEHAATAAVETVVASLAGFFDLPEDGVPVTVACAEGETHALPARMITAHLLYLGWRATFLGPSVPAGDLEAYLGETPTSAVILSCSISTNLTGARASIRAAHAAGVPVIAGGQAFGRDDRLARAVGADAWAPDPREIDIILETWSPDIEASERAAVVPAPDLETIGARRLQILAGAVEEVASVVEPGTVTALGHRNWEDVTLAYDALAAALTVADPGILSDFARWHAERLAESDRAPGLVADLLGALRRSIGDAAPEAARYLDEALAASG